MKTYKIHLIRNGLTDGNLNGQYIGHTDIELCDDGIAQIRQLKEGYEYPEVQAVFSSPLKRCVATAQEVFPHLNPIIINDLIEYNFGEFEGKTADELKGDEAFIHWLAGGPDAAPPFGESNAGFAKRVCTCFQKIAEGLMKTGTTSAAIVTHGGVIMTIMSAFCLPEMPAHEWLTPSGCGYTISIIPSIWSKMSKVEIFAEIPMEPENEEQRDKSNNDASLNILNNDEDFDLE